MPQPLVTPLPRNMLDAIADAGVDLADAAREAGVDPAALEAGMTFAEVERFIAVAWRRLDDPAFGLRAGCVLRPERYGISGLTAMASPTFGSALQRKARYNRLVWGDSYRIRQDALEFTVVTESPDESKPWSYSRVDLEFASLVTFGRRFALAGMAPLKVGFRRPEPAFRPLYEDIFRCPVAFAQPANSLSFSQADAQRPLVSADARAAEWLEFGARAALERMDDSGVTARVRAQLQRMLQGDEPTLAAVASELCMSERTLQRRLSAEGQTFRRALDETRRDVAQRSLAAGKRNVPELAYLLGFEDSNSFYRSFRRWTGTTPESYRKAVVE
ncbi:AraC family transcriptional regulator [Ramlibacter tataouinensis]|uniref:AraC family transcriptional regulator n=1 Tax=Ramlibacter tataouinensis TaxID=94132 RepID=UPI001314FF3F|nr:AraC family transcriptional regulator [Ramlibacter tataouinensis]